MKAKMIPIKNKINIKRLHLFFQCTSTEV